MSDDALTCRGCGVGDPQADSENLRVERWFCELA